MNKTEYEQLTEWEYTFPLHKADPNDPAQDPRVITGVIYPSCAENTFCNMVDSQLDFASNTDVRNAAWDFMDKLSKGRARVTVEHSAPAKATVVESYLAPTTFTLPDGDVATAGSWIGSVRINDNALLKRILDGSLQAFSIGGTAIRVASPDQIAKGLMGIPTQIKSLDIDEWSIVGKGANKRKFSIIRKMDYETIEMEDLEMENSNYEYLRKQNLPSNSANVDTDDECAAQGSPGCLCPNCDNDMNKCDQGDAGCHCSKCASNPVKLVQKSEAGATLHEMAVELVQKSRNNLSYEMAWTEAAYARPDLATILLPQDEPEPQSSRIHKASDLPPDVARGIVAIENWLGAIQKEEYPEVHEWLALAQDRVQKSGGVLTLEQAMTEVIHENPEGVAEHVRKTSRI